ncbi:hypothetical protein [Pseudomonas sp. PB3P13]
MTTAPQTTLKTTTPIDRDEYLKLANVGDIYRYQGLRLRVKEKIFESLGNDQFDIIVETEIEK